MKMMGAWDNWSKEFQMRESSLESVLTATRGGITDLRSHRRLLTAEAAEKWEFEGR